MTTFAGCILEKFTLIRFKELLRMAKQGSTPNGVKSCRRPEYNDQPSAHPIPLLRKSATVETYTSLPSEIDVPSSKDDLGPLKGIMLSSALGVSLWVWIAGIVWVMLR